MRHALGAVVVLALLPGGLAAQTAEIGAEDVAAIERLLNEFAENYNSGDYINASAAFTAQVESECGGATDLAFALSRNHEIERIDYYFSDVEPWGDGSLKADVTVTERWDGDEMEQELGLQFTREGGQWKLAGMFPIGASAYCD